MKFISCGQTGVDRAVLDVALELGIDAGGWCPAGRIAEDEVIPDKYPVKELISAGYDERTLKNVVDSEGTVIIYFGCPVGGTELTIFYCIQHKRSYVLVDAEEISVERAAVKIDKFIELQNIKVLNVAGPRASSDARANGFAREVMCTVLQKYV